MKCSENDFESDDIQIFNYFIDDIDCNILITNSRIIS